MILPAFLLLTLAAFYAWRYSRTDPDPDWAMFNFAAFTGSFYGRDFADCKTPGVHLWYWSLARLFGASIPRVRFANHFLIGAAGAVYTLATGDFWGGLAFGVLVNSGWLLAFHGNVGAVPAALVMLSFASPPWLAASLCMLALLYEPKLLLSFGFLLVFRWPVYGAVAVATCAIVALLLYLSARPLWNWIWESSVIIPARMAKTRKKHGLYGWAPWFTSTGFLYLLPWLIFAAMAKPDPVYWAPALAYLLLIGTGSVIRENHLIPLVPWIAAAGIKPEILVALCAVDWVSGGLYLGDIWQRFYLGLRQRIAEAKAVGEWLRDKPGHIWVNSLDSEVYIHARKPIPYGLAEQIEIRENAHERRQQMLETWRIDPPDWVVDGPDPGVQYQTGGYRLVLKSPLYRIWKREELRYDDLAENDAQRGGALEGDLHQRRNGRQHEHAG